VQADRLISVEIERLAVLLRRQDYPGRDNCGMGKKMPIPCGKIFDLSAFVLFVEQRVVEDLERLFGKQVIPERFKGAEK
jgi:hypothetical protein